MGGLLQLLSALQPIYGSTIAIMVFFSSKLETPRFVSFPIFPFSVGEFLWENDEQSGSGSLSRPTHVANLRIISSSILAIFDIHSLITKPWQIKYNLYCVVLVLHIMHTQLF